MLPRNILLLEFLSSIIIPTCYIANRGQDKIIILNFTFY